MNDIWKENDLAGSQGDLRALGHPQRPRQAQPRRVQQVPVMLIKNWHDTFLYSIFQRQIDLQQSQRDTGWSRGHPDTLYDLVKLTQGECSKYNLSPSKIYMAHVYILSFKDKWIQNGPKVIMVLSDTLRDLDKLNQGEYSKYQLCSSKFYMTYVYILFKDKSI